MLANLATPAPCPLSPLPRSPATRTAPSHPWPPALGLFAFPRCATARSSQPVDEQEGRLAPSANLALLDAHAHRDTRPRRRSAELLRQGHPEPGAAAAAEEDAPVQSSGGCGGAVVHCVASAIQKDSTGRKRITRADTDVRPVQRHLVQCCTAIQIQ